MHALMSDASASRAGSADVTMLLKAWQDGDQAALDTLAPLIYAELRRLARSSMRRERPGHMLETGALLNEAFLRLVKPDTPQWQNRSHFYAISARIMRRVLIDDWRARKGQKRNEGVEPIALDEALVVAPERNPNLEAVSEALDKFALVSERAAQVVELRFFGGMSIEETAAALHIAPRSVKRDWTAAKAWLRRELGDVIAPED